MIDGLRKTVKRTAYTALRGSGIYAFSRSSEKRRSRLLILCYHGISLQDEHQWAPFLYVSRERFRSRLQALRDLQTNVLPLGEALQRLRSSTLPPRSVAITFDDGFYDFLQLAVPILNDFQVPATLYWTTYYSGLKMPIINLALSYLLWKSGRQKLAFPELGLPDPLPVHTWRDRVETVQKVLAQCEARNMSTTQKDNVARQLAQRFSIDYDSFIESRLLQIMTPGEASQVHQAGIDIQLHTHRHRTPLDRDLFIREIDQNRNRILETTGKNPVHFCYPSGVYEQAFFPWLRECGIESATTCERGFAGPGVDPLLIPRVLDESNMEPIEFEGVVSGLFA